MGNGPRAKLRTFRSCQASWQGGELQISSPSCRLNSATPSLACREFGLRGGQSPAELANPAKLPIRRRLVRPTCLDWTAGSGFADANIGNPGEPIHINP